MNAEPMDAMEMRATAQQYTGPSAGRIANLIPHAVGFERGWFRTTTAVCHGGESDGLAFRQRPDGNGIDVRCHTGGCTRGHIVTALEGLARSARARPLQRTRLARHRGSARGWLQTATVAKLEREKGFEPSALCLGSRGSTARLAPLSDLMLNFFSTLRLANRGSNACFRRRAE